MFPIWFVVLGIIVYAIAYFVYAKWFDRNVWEPDPKKATPAHVYMDGIQYFPVSKYVLYGFQFKGIAGLGPIFGPFIALFYGWVPALIWILIGNFFIGWIHDYSSLFLSVRNEGKTMGPLTYEIISPRARKVLMGFLLFYLILITAVFVLLCSLFFNLYRASVPAMIFLIIGGVISGILLYKVKTGVGVSTLVGLIITAIGVVIGVYTGPSITFGDLNFYMLFTCIILFIGTVVPLIYFTQPVIYVASYPAIFGIVLIILGALISPVTGVAIQQPAWLGPLGTSGQFWGTPGPIWPILMVSIACGAISGWHSLVSTSGSSTQLDVETDALPVGAGSMITEGLLALASLAAFMVVSGEAVKMTKWDALIKGAVALISPYTGGAAAQTWLSAFYAMWLELYALTIELLVLRFFWLAMSDVLSPVPALKTAIGNKYIATIIALVVGWAFAYSGAWVNLWLLFGGSNQLLAGLALTLITVYLAKVKKPTIFTLIPALFMVITCEVALLYEGGKFLYVVSMGKFIAKGALTKNPAAATALNVIFGIVGLVLFILGLIVAYDGFKALRRAKKGE